MLTDNQYLLMIEEVLPKLSDTPTQIKLADICFKLRSLLKERQRGPSKPKGGRLRNEYMRDYMRRYRAKQKLNTSP